MNCCNEFGQCTQGQNCPVREAARDKAARHFWEPNQALHIDVYTGPSWFVRALDWVGNLPRRFGRWWDGLNELGRFNSVVGLVAVCAVFAVAVVG